MYFMSWDISLAPKCKPMFSIKQVPHTLALPSVVVRWLRRNSALRFPFHPPLLKKADVANNKQNGGGVLPSAPNATRGEHST